MSKDNHLVAIECGPGWGFLVAPIVQRANEIDATISQIKEKFGMLRVYLSSHVDDDELCDMIDKAEMDSATTCEMCGKPGVNMTNGGWLKTLCKEHATDLGYRRKAA